MASAANKPYLADRRQQDCEEFLTALVTGLKHEMDQSEISNLAQFYGKEKIIRKFLHTAEGDCHRCNQMARTDEEDFLTLKLTVPDTKEAITLSTLVQEHFSEQLEQFPMKCSFCCKCKKGCLLSGPCKQRPGVMQNILTRCPDILTIQLLRFKPPSKKKIETKVLKENMLELPNLQRYSLAAIVDHRGKQIIGGHFVSYIKDEQRWLLCNDETTSEVNDSCIESPDHYIFLYRKYRERSSYPEFKPTDDWQEVQAWQSIPIGCLVDLNIITGKTFAKLDRSYTKPGCLSDVGKEKTNINETSIDEPEVGESTKGNASNHDYPLKRTTRMSKTQINQNNDNVDKTNSVLVDSSFIGFKIFPSGKGFPNNDGHLWNGFAKKKKGLKKFQCKNCPAVKYKTRSKSQLRQNQYSVRLHSITVKYENAHSVKCRPNDKNVDDNNKFDNEANEEAETSLSSDKEVIINLETHEKGTDNNAILSYDIEAPREKCHKIFDHTKNDKRCLSTSDEDLEEEIQQIGNILDESLPHTTEIPESMKEAPDDSSDQLDDAHFEDLVEEVDMVSESLPLNAESLEVPTKAPSESDVNNSKEYMNDNAPKVMDETGKTRQSEEPSSEEEFENDTQIVTLGNVAEVNENVDSGIAYLIPNTTVEDASEQFHDADIEGWFDEEEQMENTVGESLPQTTELPEVTAKAYSVSDLGLSDVNKSTSEINANEKNSQDGESSSEDEFVDDTQIITLGNVAEVNENVDSGIAYLIPNTTVKPRISRKIFQWGPNQPGKKGLSSYKCIGVSFFCPLCKITCPSSLNKCTSCLGPIKEKQCGSSKYMFVCEGKCNRKIWPNTCCDIEGQKLVILYPTAHTCEQKSLFHPVSSEEDLLHNLKVFNESESNKFEIIQATKLPSNIDGNKLYLMKIENGKNDDDMIKDGRRYKKSMKTKSSIINEIFGKNMDKRTRLYKCRGTMYCFNNDCPFLRRFDSINQVQFDMKSSGEKHCVSCGEPMLILNCDARKYVVKDDQFILVKHEGTHDCPAASMYEIDIVHEIEN